MFPFELMGDTADYSSPDCRQIQINQERVMRINDRTHRQELYESHHQTR